MSNHEINKILFHIDLFFLNCSNCRSKCQNEPYDLDFGCSVFIAIRRICRKIKCNKNPPECQDQEYENRNCVLHSRVFFRTTRGIMELELL